MRCGFDGIPTVRFGAVLGNRESYGAVPCGFQILEILRCGSVRFSEIVNATVWFGAVFRSEPYGAVRLYFMSYGAVRCGFQEGKNPTVRCGAVLKRARILRCGGAVLPNR